MTRGRVVEAMNTFVGEVQQKRFVAGPIRQPLCGIVRQFIGHVLLARHLAAIDVECLFAWCVRALPPKTHPVIESGSCGITRSAHVPFADECRFVIGLLQKLRKRHPPFSHPVDIVDNLVVVHVLSGEKGRPRRRAQRSCDKRIGELHTAVCQRVDMRRFDERVPHVAERVVPEIVDQDEHDIRR